MHQSFSRLHSSLFLLIVAWPGFMPIDAVPPENLRSLGSEKVRLSMAQQPVHAIAENDCAPWDGPAFGLWIPADHLGGATQSWIYLRIWQAPQNSLGKFVFPDQAQRKKGAVIYFFDLKSPRFIHWANQPRQQLKGNVLFTRVNREQSILGSLDFLTDKGIRLRGSFEAKWIASKRVCG